MHAIYGNFLWEKKTATAGQVSRCLHCALLHTIVVACRRVVVVSSSDIIIMPSLLR